MKFYPADWRSDPALRSCTISARGLWIEMMAIMHEAEPYGSLLVKGKRVDKKQLAALAGVPERECTALLLELEGMRVFERDTDGTIYSRRMRRDHARAEEGRKQVSKRWTKKENEEKPTRGPNRSDDRVAITQKPEARIDVAVDACEPSRSFVLAEKLLVIAGHDTKFWPPGWCGAPNRIETWLSQGWKSEIIIAAVTAAAARKRGSPANSVQFFENAIAEEHARQAAPLPKVEIREAPTLTVSHGKPKSAIIQAADDLVRKLAEFDGPARGADELRGVEG